MMRASWSIDGELGSSSFILEVHLAFINRHAWRPTKYQVVLELDSGFAPSSAQRQLDFLLSDRIFGSGTRAVRRTAEIENVNHVFQPDGR